MLLIADRVAFLKISIKNFEKKFLNKFVLCDLEYVREKRERRSSYSTSPILQLQGQTYIYSRAITDND